MKPNRWWLAAGPVIALGLVACGGGSKTPNPWGSWNTLRLETQSVPLFKGQVEMTRSGIESPERLETEATASFLGQTVLDAWTLTRFDSNGRTTEYVSRSRERGRRYSFGERGYVVEKLKAPEQGDVPLQQWSVTLREEFDNRDENELFDYFGMLLQLRHLGLDRIGDEGTLWIATPDGPQPFRIVVSASRESELSYTDLSTDEVIVAAVNEFRLRVIPADPDAAGEGFLRMEGETEIWVEAETKTPLEISGKVPKVPGRVKLRLFAMG